MQLLKSGGNFIVKLSPHMYSLGILIAGEVEKKGRTEKLVNVGLILFSYHGRSRTSHIREK